MMGEIKEPAYPVTKRLVQQGADIETAKLFAFADRQPGWASKVWREGLHRKALPDTKALGALRGKYVLPKIYNDVTELVRARGRVEQTYDTAIGAWKLGKVVLNPATHFRNKISNKILLDLSGMGYGEQLKYSLRAFKEYRKNSREYQVAKQYFARTTQIKGEILDDILRTNATSKGKGFEWALNTVKGGLKKAVKKPADLYQHEEFINKFMKYLQQRDKGKSVIESVQEANKWLFDYGDLAAAEIKYARRIMPFYTFPRKAIPRVAEAMAVRPHTVAKYPLMAKTMTQYSLYNLNMSYKDYEEVQKVLPDYMKNGSYILMPYRDKNDDLRFYDWTYIIPWGALHDAEERGVLKTIVQNPLMTLINGIMLNKDAFTGREIWKETDTDREKTFKKMQYIWEGLTPSLAPRGLYWDKLKETALHIPTKQGKERPITEVVAHTVFGQRTQAIDVDQQRRFRIFDLKRKQKELRSKVFDATQRRRSGNITEVEYQKRIERLRKQLSELRD